MALLSRQYGRLDYLSGIRPASQSDQSYKGLRAAASDACKGAASRLRALLDGQEMTSLGEVMRTQVQPVSLHTRLSADPASARL